MTYNSLMMIMNKKINMNNKILKKIKKKDKIYNNQILNIIKNKILYKIKKYLINKIHLI